MKANIDRNALNAMLKLARAQHPHEVILLLRGVAKKGEIRISEFLLPPFASSGTSFADFPSHMLPIDFSIVGTAHSHPSGSTAPSTRDLNNFYSKIMIILAYPYREDGVAVFNSRGESIPIAVAG